jgi:hypothetical protein
VITAACLAPAAWATWSVHPYQLSYYNALIGGPRGAWSAGFELSYWYDAFTPRIIADLNAKLPPDAVISYANDQSNPQMVPQDLQSTGALRGDLRMWDPARSRSFPSMWLLTHDSKASSFTRLLFALTPWYESRPSQLDGLRVLTVADPVAVSRAWALQLLCHGPRAQVAEAPAPRAPGLVRALVPPLARLWGDGLSPVAPPRADPQAITWAQTDPASMRSAAREVVAWAHGPTGAPPPFPDGSPAARLMALLARDDRPGMAFSAMLLIARPEALAEAVEILIARGNDVRRVLEHAAYRDPAVVGGYLDLTSKEPRTK